MTHGERKLISIQCQMECVESKLDGQDSHSDYILHMRLVQNIDTKSLKYCCN